MHHKSLISVLAILTHNYIHHWLPVASFIHRDTTAFQLDKLASLLHLNYITDRSDITLDVLRCGDRLRQHLIDDILDELTPLHLLISIDVNLLKQSDQPMNHLDFLLPQTWHF